MRIVVWVGLLERWLCSSVGQEVYMKLLYREVVALMGQNNHDPQFVCLWCSISYLNMTAPVVRDGLLCNYIIYVDTYISIFGR